MIKAVILRIVLFHCTILLLISCRDEVEDQFPFFRQEVVVNSIIQEGVNLKLNLSFAEQLDSSKLRFVDNASVELFIDGEFREKLNYLDSGNYISSCVVEPLLEYSCRINIPGFDEVSCVQKLPLQPSLISIEHINIAGHNEEGVSYPALEIQFENDTTKMLFFELEVRFLSYGEIENVSILNIEDPIILNEGIPILLFSNDIIDGDLYTLRINYYTRSGQSNDGIHWRTSLYPFVVELRQVTEDYYRFKKQLYLYEQGKDADGIITSMINANLYSNIENGYGIFAGYSSTISDTITPNLEGYYD